MRIAAKTGIIGIVNGLPGLFEIIKKKFPGMRFMIKKFSATILIDDQTDHPLLQSEHGFFVWIEADDKRILFDTGQSDIYIRNAAALGIDPHSVDMRLFASDRNQMDHTLSLLR
jgi:hypothetical protein